MQYQEIYVLQPWFIKISCMRRVVSRGKFIFNLKLDYSCLIRTIRKVEPLVKFISENHSSSKTTIFSPNNLTFSLDVWSGFSFLSKCVFNSYYSDHFVTKYKPILGDW